jgi:hypothetical protein
MKTDNRLQGQLLCRMNPAITRPVISGISAAAMLWVCGCATHQPADVTRDDAAPLPESLRVRLGTIALEAAPELAVVSFDKAKGQIETFGERASVAAAGTLDSSGVSGEPIVQAVAGVAGFVMAPVAALAEGILASERLSPDKLAICESNLLYQMNTMAAQERFQNWVSKTADEKTRRRLILVEVTNTTAGQPYAESRLETRVREMRLERTGKGDSSYALLIKAQVRLTRTADGAVLYDRPVEYRSGTCLFLDWTLSDSIQRVTETAYREMAERVVDQLFVGTPDGPLLAGTGFQKLAGRQHNKDLARVSRGPGPGSADPAYSVAGRVSSSGEGSLRQPAAQLVSYSLVNTGAIGIYSTATVSRVSLQRPLTKDEAGSEALSDTEWMFDGLQNNPNLMICLPSIAAAIPVSLWLQGKALVCGLTDRKFNPAEAQMTAAVRETRPHEDLANQVAQQLEPRTSQPVMLVAKPLSPDADEEGVMMQCVARGTLAWLPNGQTPASYLAGEEVDTALEIQVISATLAGKERVNPPMALCVEAEARLLRARDGQEIYSCPIHYRSQERKYVQWAAHDAQLFRQELQTCYHELGTIIVNQLVSHGLVAPGQGAYPNLVRN